MSATALVVETIEIQRRFHSFNNPKDKDYINELSEECHSVDEKGCFGKRPPLFYDYAVWIRKNLAAMREAFGAKGVDRHNFTSPESLGFSYNQSQG